MHVQYILSLAKCHISEYLFKYLNIHIADITLDKNVTSECLFKYLNIQV